MCYAGIDWADDHHNVVVIDDAAKTCGSLRVDHSVNGLAQLNSFLKEITSDSVQLACIVETSQGLLIAIMSPGNWTKS